MTTRISTHFEPGDIGAIIASHGQYYAAHWGFPTVFEARVAVGLGDFAERQQPSDLVLIARDDTGLVASLILDLNDPTSGDRGAHLRWFIVSDRARGQKLGHQMMTRAMDHVDKNAGGSAWLTTFAGLDAARHLYEAHGFALHAQEEGAIWGSSVMEQEFRRIGSDAAL